MAEIKVLALDLDGTLTNSQKEVTPRTRAALDAAIAKGVTIVLASGRPTAGVLPLAKELGLDKKGGCILSYNGGKIIDCRTGETLYQKQLDAQYVPELCAFAAAQNVTIITYNKEGVVTEHPDDKWALRECFTCKLPMTGVDDLAKYVDYPICKMLITLDPARRDEVWAAGKKQFDGRIDLYPSSPFFIEAVPLGVAKDGSLAALLELAGRVQIRRQHRKPDGLRRRPERPLHDRVRRCGRGHAERRRAGKGRGRLCDCRRQRPRRCGRGCREVYFKVTRGTQNNAAQSGFI